MNLTEKISEFLSSRRREIAYTIFLVALFLVTSLLQERLLSSSFPDLSADALVSASPFVFAGIAAGVVLPLYLSLVAYVGIVFGLVFMGKAGMFAFIVALISVALGIFASRFCNSRRRTVLVSLGGALTQSFVSIMLWFFMKGEPGSLALFVSSMLTVFPGLGFLFFCMFVAEDALLITTRVKLIELCSETYPLLMELKERAPGTYFHSRNVAYLSEKAARAIGADEYLCRAGGLYHDVGKLWNPTYYSENQIEAPNVHEDVSREVSCSIIITHIEEGVKRARKSRVGVEIERIIQTHHGDGPIYYYCTNRRKGRDRYPGPVPATREEAIVMLADALEAVARSRGGGINLGEIRQMVDFVVERAKKDDQLKWCGLSDSDIEMIKNAFSEVLAGIYHQRVKYTGSDAYLWGEEDGAGLREEGEKGVGGRCEEVEENDMPGPGKTKYH